MDASYPGQSHTCLKRFMKMITNHSGPPIETMKPVTLFLIETLQAVSFVTYISSRYTVTVDAGDAPR